MLHIAADSVDRALAWEARVRAAIDGLSDFHGHAVDDEASRRFGRKVRKLVFERTYLIYYDADDAMATVYAIDLRHGSRVQRRP